MSKQTHIFATRSDLESGLRKFEAKTDLKYARCDLYYGPVYEQYLSLLDWADLGKNTTGDHISGPQFLVVPRDRKINIESVPQVVGCDLGTGGSPAWTIDSTGCLPKHAAPLHQYLTELEGDSGLADRESAGQVRYAVSQRLNPDSLTFLPGGIYKQEKILVCGHIGTISDSEISRTLYKSFVSHLTRDFEKIGSYRVGPEAVRLMNEGYRMVTIGITSPAAYDLYRSVAR
jgi:hypothetical protein